MAKLTFLVLIIFRCQNPSVQVYLNSKFILTASLLSHQQKNIHYGHVSPLLYKPPVSIRTSPKLGSLQVLAKTDQNIKNKKNEARRVILLFDYK